MRRFLKAIAASTLVCGLPIANAGSSWSTQDYDLYPGDFNGDGLTDLLYVAKDPGSLSGILLSDGVGVNNPIQSWDSRYLGIPWSAGLYNVIVADFNGDGKADIFLQRKTPGDHYLLLSAGGLIVAINQTIPNGAVGVNWSADQHRLVAGDFNGDGRADLFLQAADATGLNAVVLTDSAGQFTAVQPDQSWSDGYAGLKWAASEASVYAADFNGDSRADLLVQANPLPGTGPGTSQPIQFLPNSNGVVLAQNSKSIFVTEGLQAWSHNGFSAEWSPLNSVVVPGDINIDGRSDVLLQGRSAVDGSYLLFGRPRGAVFMQAVAMDPAVARAATNYRLLTGHFTADSAASIYMQSTSASAANQLGIVANGTMLTDIRDAVPPISASTMSTGAPPSFSNSARAPVSVASPALAGAGVATETYTYDALGRLRKVQSPDGTQATYDFDPAGNRLASTSGVPVQPTTYTDLGTLTQGLYRSATGPNWTFFKGYRTFASPIIGSYAPLALTGGQSVHDLFDFAVCSSQSQPYDCPYSGVIVLTQYGQMIVTGFAADPGAAWLVTVTAGATVRSGSSATYSFSGGMATWTWSGATGSFGLSGTGAVSVSVVHK
jgi:YD repeat-containing protein